MYRGNPSESDPGTVSATLMAAIEEHDWTIEREVSTLVALVRSGDPIVSPAAMRALEAVLSDASAEPPGWLADGNGNEVGANDGV